MFSLGPRRLALAWTSTRTEVRPTMRVVSHHRRESRRARTERGPTRASDPRTRKRSPDRLARASEGRRVGRSGRTRASRGDTRTCLFKHLCPTRGEHVAWEDPRPRGTRLVAPRPPAFSLRAPPVVKQEVSLHPRPSTRAAKVRVSALLHGTGGRFHTSACFRASPSHENPFAPDRGAPAALPAAMVPHRGALKEPVTPPLGSSPRSPTRSSPASRSPRGLGP